MRNNKGFSLVELLAVIVILAIIGLIAIPIYNNIINDSKKDAFTDSTQILIRELESYVITNTATNYNNPVDITLLDLELNNHNITSGNFYLENNFIILVDITDGNFCANGNKNNLTVTEGSC